MSSLPAPLAAGGSAAPRTAHALDALLPMALVLLVVALFHDLPGGYWRGDDTAILAHAMGSRGLRAFIDPAHWQQLSPSNLTPWLTLSFKLDLRLAGMEPRAFYVHQVVALALVALAAYALLRRWLAPAGAAAAVALFLLGEPTAQVTELLMTRHYLEGLLFALLALLGFLHAQRRGELRWAIAGAFAYALATTAKETYVPLVLLLLVLPSPQSGKARWRLVLPYLAVAAAYVLWRRFMLGTAVGGYGPALLSPAGVALLAQALARFPAFLVGPAGVPALILWLAVVVLALARRPAAIPAAIVLAIAVIGPLLPLATFPGIHGPDRYLFLVWFIVAVSFALALSDALRALPAPWQRAALAAPVLAAALAATHANTRALADVRHASQQEFDSVGRFLMQAGAHDAYLPSAGVLGTYWYVTALCELKQRRGATCAVALLPGFAPPSGLQRLHAYDPQQRAMVDRTSALADELARAVAIDRTRPLSAHVSLDGQWGRWQFGPHEVGHYAIVSPVFGRYPVPRSGQLRTTLKQVPLQVHYQSPEGWTTATPTLQVQPGRPAEFSR